MKPPHFRSAVCTLLLLASGAAFGASFNSLIGDARDQLGSQRYVEALASARDAVRSNAADHTGYYYVALAYLGMERYDEADTAAAQAAARAPESARPTVEKLIATIKGRRDAVVEQRNAEAALADGLAGKAARLYEQAWIAGQVKPELGYKAAELYANRLNQPGDAARVLRQIVASNKGQPVADQAEQALKLLAPGLRQIAEGHLRAAQTQSGPELERSLQQAEDADPGLAQIYLLRAQHAARGDAMAALQKAVKELARRDLATPATLAALPQIERWMEQPAFAEFLNDLIGANQQQVVQLLRARREAELQRGAELEEAAWARALKGRTGRAFTAYLDQYPQGRHAAEAQAGREQYKTRPPRPNFPFQLSEEVWQALEASDLYRSWPATPWVKIVRVSEHTTEVGSYPPTKARFSTLLVYTPLSEKCGALASTSAMIGSSASTSTTYYCAGIRMMSTDHQGKLISTMGAIRSLAGSYPTQAGSVWRGDYTINMYLPGAPSSVPVKYDCKFGDSVSASQLHTQLPGRAWPLLCGAPGQDFLVEALGLQLSAAGHFHSRKLAFVLPAKGESIVTESKSLLSPDYRSTEMFSVSTIKVFDHAPGKIGLVLVPVDAAKAAAAGLAAGRGGLIQSVVAGRPAASAGLQAGDTVLKVDGNEIDDVDGLISAIEDKRSGDTIVLTIWRNERRDVTVVVDE